MVERRGTYVALLRGINVGGANIIPMAALRRLFERLGFSDVRTYIQSGNVIFRAPATGARRREALIERALTMEFGYTAAVVLRSDAQMRATVTDAPHGFGSAADEYRYDVVFVKAPLTAEEALASVRTREGVDAAWAGNGVIYFSRLISRAAQSYLPRLAGLPIYKQMTVRNWNTTTKLLRLIEGNSGSARGDRATLA